MLREQCELETAEAKRIAELRSDMVMQAHSELVGFNKAKRAQRSRVECSVGGSIALVHADREQRGSRSHGSRSGQAGGVQGFP